jgi:hypothetical protein
MSIKRFFLIATALFASQHNEQLAAMDQMPADVLNLILSLLSMRAQLNFMQTAGCYAKLHESNIPTHCSGCTINSTVSPKETVKKIKNISVTGFLDFKNVYGNYKFIFNTLRDNASITDLRIFDYDICPNKIQYLTKNLSNNNKIKSLTITNSTITEEKKNETKKTILDIEVMTSLLKRMPHLEHCVLSHVELYCSDENPCVRFEELGTQLFQLKSIAISNSSVGYYDSLHWLLIALKTSKTIEELTLNDIHTKPIDPFTEAGNYSKPVVFNGGVGTNFINSMNNCKTMRQLTLGANTYLKYL